MQKLPTFQLPAKLEDRNLALERLVQDLWLAVQDLQEALIVPQKVAPPKIQEGLIRYADGTNWNPGAGAGLYQYIGGWNKL